MTVSEDSQTLHSPMLLKAVQDLTTCCIHQEMGPDKADQNQDKQNELKYRN